MTTKRGFCRLCNSFLGCELKRPPDPPEFCDRCVVWAKIAMTTTFVLILELALVCVGALVA